MGTVRNRKPDYKKGTRKDIIEIIHMTGVIPAKALNLMNVPRTYKQKIKDMEKEGVIEQARVKNFNHVRLVYCLKPYNEISSLFSSDLREGYYESYSAYGMSARKMEQVSENLPYRQGRRLLTAICMKTERTR